MPTWLEQSFAAPTDWGILISRLLLAILFGAVAAGVYRSTRRQTPENRTFPGTLLLLSVLIAMVTQVIGDNVARAFSLVGALSIVRFRAVVQDTQDTAFVIFAVAVGMAIGAGQPAVALAGSAAVALAALVLKGRSTAGEPKSTGAEYELDVRVGWSPTAEATLKSCLAAHGLQVRSLGASTARQGAALNLSYELMVPDDMDLSPIIAELNRIDSVQSIELKREK